MERTTEVCVLQIAAHWQCHANT